KSTVLSIHTTTDTMFNEQYKIITCNWLTKDFELHKILLLVKPDSLYEDIIEALLKDLEEEKYQNFSQTLITLHDNGANNNGHLKCLIQDSLQEWAIKSVISQETSEIIVAVENATNNLCSVVEFLKNIEVQIEIQNMQTIFSDSTIIDIQNAEKISCRNYTLSGGCIYHKIAFLKLMEKPFIQLVNNYNSYVNAYIRKKGEEFKELILDSLPFGIFSNLLQLFEPLEHITCSDCEISREKFIGLIAKIGINADNMLRELQFSDNLEHKILKSFLTSISSLDNGTDAMQLCKSLIAKPLALFLDPRPKPDEVSTATIEYALKKCQSYYLENIFSDSMDKSIQAANKELECYTNRPQLSLDGDINPYEWWQGSKKMLPGLAALAREYLPTLTVDKEVPINNLDKLLRTYNNEDMAEKIAFLQYNM
ncbi:28047_t:CDS:2, partial [Dentiscutata erythropus]